MLSLNDSAAQGYTEYTYDVTATGTSTELLFVGRQDPSFWYLDDVSVVDVSAGSSGASVSIGRPGNDNFIFHPGIGADTITNFNTRADTIELDHFANIQNVQELASLITTDVHADAVIELGHSDSITIPGLTAAYLQAHPQSLVHLH